eukprot:TRINITY_DN3891_c0_g1_i1.p1 TRINITY_DN3891_c0_g1~~TRINITY_DN3891_c0_g1_i1.p1  ORF type:complete len:107 (-),score=15.53 TRINITY_DN3891_c0_g1_i1:299-619(-)
MGVCGSSDQGPVCAPTLTQEERNVGLALWNKFLGKGKDSISRKEFFDHLWPSDVLPDLKDNFAGEPQVTKELWIRWLTSRKGGEDNSTMKILLNDVESALKDGTRF